jgi:Uma2 family endonuclease
MIAQVQEKRAYSPEEYLELELRCKTRNEYIDGEIISMSGATPNHNRITGNFYAALNFALKRQPYEVFVTDQRIWIPRKKIYTYPDVVVVKGALEFQEGRKDTITNPFIIAEVLSKSTSDYDQTGKFAAYRTIPGFQEYILIDQYSFSIEHYIKTEPRKWIFQEYDESDTSLCLSSIPFEIALADLYEKAEFEPIEAKSVEVEGETLG